jgi:hypothetical protein
MVVLQELPRRFAKSDQLGGKEGRGTTMSEKLKESNPSHN